MKRSRSKKKVKDKLCIYHVNMNGFKSKCDSLNGIIMSVKPDILCICEVKSATSTYLKNFFKEVNYEVISGKKGLLVAAKPHLKLINVTTSSHPNILSGRVMLKNIAIRITEVYGPQENEPAENREEFFNELSVELEAGGSTETVVCGDFNAKITNERGVTGISPNGKLMENVLRSYNLKAVNFHENCVGYWTRVQVKNGVTERSVIDYILLPESIWLKVSSVTIDEERNFSPFGVRRTKSGNKKVPSDHNAILLTLDVESVTKSKTNSSHNRVAGGWKLTEDGLLKYNEITADVNNDESSNYSDLHCEITQCMDQCFKRTKPNCDRDIHDKKIYKSNATLKVLKSYIKCGRAEKKAAMVYIHYMQELELERLQQHRCLRIRKKIEELEDDDGSFAVGKFWNIRKIATKGGDDKSSVITKDGVEVFDGPAIIPEYEKEFQARLNHREMVPILKRYEEVSNELFELLLDKSILSSEPDFTLLELTKVISRFKKGKPGPDLFPYEVLKYAGEGLLKKVLAVLNKIKNELVVPDEWLDVIIKTLYKNKGSKKLLEYYRGIFLSSVIYKTMEQLIKLRIIQFTERTNLYQAARRNRSPADSIFLVKGVIDHAKYLNSSVTLTFYDYKTCFDSLWLEDSMLTLWKLGVRSSLFALIYRMNENCNIRINTPFGMSKSISCPRIVKQGTVLGPDLCSTSTAEVVDNKVVSGGHVGQVKVKAVVYVDDTTDVNVEINNTVTSHNDIYFFSKKKKASLHPDKCFILPINYKATDSVPSLFVDGVKLSAVSENKHLGDIFNTKGDYLSLVKDRKKKGEGIIITSLALSSEMIVGKHYLITMVLLYRSVYLYSILCNSQVWSHMIKKEEDILAESQMNYLKRMLKLPSSASNTGILLELGVLPIKYEIHKRKLSFLWHIASLEDSDPVKHMYHTQKEFPFEKNWGNEVSQLCKRYGIESNLASIGTLSKESWKRTVSDAVEIAAFEAMVIKNSSLSKTKDLRYDCLQGQEYLRIQPSDIACVLIRLRIKSTLCLKDRTSSSEAIPLCRLCGLLPECIVHAVNCTKVRGNDEQIVDVSYIRRYDVDWHQDFSVLRVRYERFCELIQQITVKMKNAAGGDDDSAGTNSLLT